MLVPHLGPELPERVTVWRGLPAATGDVLKGDKLTAATEEETASVAKDEARRWKAWDGALAGTWTKEMVKGGEGREGGGWSKGLEERRAGGALCLLPPAAGGRGRGPSHEASVHQC